MTRYFTADLHLGHANIIRYSGRPFRDAEHMNRALIDNWNDTVGPDDEVWILGDLALGRLDDALTLVASLRGSKTLLCGNHDRCWDGRPDAAKWRPRYEAAGIDSVVQGTIETIIGGASVACSHFSYEGDQYDRGRFDRFRPVDKGGVLLHGHVHEQWRQKGRQINVGVDVWDYRPVDEARLIDLILAA